MNLLSCFSGISSRSLIGLDIQSQSINLVQVKKARHGFVTELGAVAELPANTLVEGIIRDWEAVTLVLREIVERFCLRGKSAAVMLPANLVRMMSMQIPHGMSEDAVESEIYAQVVQDFPGLVGSLSVDFTVIDNQSLEYTKVFFVAAKQDYLLRYVGCVNSTGLIVKIVDIDICTVIRLFAAAFYLPANSGAVNAVVHKNNQLAMLVIFNANEIVFYQKWNINDLTDFIPQLLNHIQIFIATFTQRFIHHLVISDVFQTKGSDLEAFIRMGVREVSIQAPLTRMTWSKRICEQTKSNLFIACGVAMREAPQW